MRVLVTGATGFVGQALVPALIAAGHEVTALTRGNDGAVAGKRHAAGPIETIDAEGWAAALRGIDVVVHLAGIAHIGKDVPAARYDAVNHLATAALGSAAAKAGVRRIVFLSSIRAITGAVAPEILTDAALARPTDAYGASKRAAELALQATDGIETVSLRPTLIIGRHARGNLALLQKIAATPLPLPFGAITARRSLVSLADVVAAILRALEDPAMAGRVLGLADPVPMTLGEMIAALRAGMGRPARLLPVPQALMAWPLRVLGRADIWERLAGQQIVQPDGLTALGFTGPLPARQALFDLGSAARHSTG